MLMPLLMLMLTISNHRRTPHPHIVLLTLLLSIRLYEDGEHALKILSVHKS